jgi:L-sorbose 1-phosphate reductase
MPIPEIKEDELLVKVDAVSLCFSDQKIIAMGGNHPRLVGRDLSKDPVVPGHEISVTIEKVGKSLSSNYQAGERFTLQPDVWYKGKSTPLGYVLPGAYAKYLVIGKEILQGDEGNYLIRVPDDISFAAAALTEPWACVEASYLAKYRATLKSGGNTWVVGNKSSRQGYNAISLLELAQPIKIFLSGVTGELLKQFTVASQKNNIILESIDFAQVLESEMMFDDILCLDQTAGIINQASIKLAKKGVLSIISDTSSAEKISIDLGRLHYDDIQYQGTTSLTLIDAYKQTPIRTEFKAGGTMWVLGGGGPMGRMHLQRAIESKQKPARILATEMEQLRLTSLIEDFTELAQKAGVELMVVDPAKESKRMIELLDHIQQTGGVDDVEVMVSVPAAVDQCIPYLGEKGVMSLFAGLKRGDSIGIPYWNICGPKQIRFYGHSGSGLSDQKAVLQRRITNDIMVERSVAAVGGFCQIADGVRAMKENRFPGKIVIYPQIHDFPLTAIKDLPSRLPGIGRMLGLSNIWSKDVEELFIKLATEREK